MPVKNILCKVPYCVNTAVYEVFAVSYCKFPEDDIEFREADARCRYICHHHMIENEIAWEASKDKPLYTNIPSRHYGSYDYIPIAELHEELYIASANRSIKIYSNVSGLTNQLRQRPELVYEISPRQFEIVVADVFRKQGFDVELTQTSRDGGVDIYVRREDVFGPLLYIVECKRYSRENKVGIGIVQRVHGVAQGKGATKGVIVTTSSFTEPAISFAAPFRRSLSLNDYRMFANWLSECRTT